MMNLKFRCRLSAFIVFFSVSFAYGIMAQTSEGKQSITIDELKNHMYFLASDFLGGRVSYEPGYNIAAEYCASQFKSIGLEPVIKDKNGNLTYFQEVPLIKRTIDKESKVSLHSSKETIDLESENDYKIPDRIMNLPGSEADIVFLGYGIEEPKYKWNDYSKLDIEGKAVILLMGTPRKNGKPVLPDSIDQKYKSIPGLQAKLSSLIKRNPSFLIVVPDQDLLSMIPWSAFPDNCAGDQYSYAIEKKKDEGFHIPVVYLLNPESLKKVFKNQIYTPGNIEKDGIKSYKTFQLNDLKWKSTFSISKSDTIITKNIIGLLRGTDNELKNQYVTVGGHLDHIPSQKGQVSNGADDDASGSVGVLELAEAMVNQPARRSILYILYAGEELGLVGSYHFVNNPPVPLESIVININLDMIGRSDSLNKTTRALYIMVHKKYLNEMTRFIGDVNNQGVKWPLIFDDCEKTPGDSDHSSFNDKGIPNMHFFSGMHKDVHMPTDDAEFIDYEKMQKIIQLVYDLCYKVGNMDKLTF